MLDDKSRGAARARVGPVPCSDLNNLDRTPVGTYAGHKPDTNDGSDARIVSDGLLASAVVIEAINDA